MTTVNDFVSLLDSAILCAESVAKRVAGSDKAWMAEDAIAAKTQFQKIKESWLAGELPSSEGAGLGITRALGEWAPDDLYVAGKAVEDFYRTNLR